MMSQEDKKYVSKELINYSDDSEYSVQTVKVKNITSGSTYDYKNESVSKRFEELNKWYDSLSITPTFIQRRKDTYTKKKFKKKKKPKTSRNSNQWFLNSSKGKLSNNLDLTDFSHDRSDLNVIRYTVSPTKNDESNQWQNWWKHKEENESSLIDNVIK